LGIGDLPHARDDLCVVGCCVPSESVNVSPDVRKNGGPWAVVPATVTVTFPLDVPTGTVATIAVSLQLTTFATEP